MSNPTPPENNPQGYNPQGNNQPGYHQQSPAGTPQAYNQQGAGYPPLAKKQSRALPIIIGIVVGLLAIAGLGWALGLFSSDDAPAPATETSVEDTGTDATDEPSADETTTDEPATDDADSEASDGPRVADPDEQGNQNNQGGELTDELRDLVESQHRLDPNDPRAIGDLDADVIIELYSDYRCGYCKAFRDEVFPDLAPLFEDGTIRLEYNSMPVLGEPSVLAAQASHAAALQDKFWEFHDLAFAFEGEFTEQAMIDLASGIEGIDIAKFEADMTSQETVDYIAAEQKNGKDIGIQGTPSFMIGYSLVPGFIETPQFQALIEHELAR